MPNINQLPDGAPAQTGDKVPVYRSGTTYALTLSALATLIATSTALTGTPTAPTAAPGTNTTQLANTAFVTAAVTAGSGISNGDKGDITVGSLGQALTVDPDAVTYAKLQDVSAAGRVLCRGSAAGAGDAQECDLGASIGMTGTTLHLGARDYGDFTCTGTAASCVLDSSSVSSSDVLDDTLSLSDIADTAVHSGTYTPTLTGVANVSSSTARQCTYQRIGSTVHVYCSLDVTVSAGSTTTQLGVSLPVASNLANAYDLNGPASCRTAAIDSVVLGDATNDRAELQFTSVESPSSYTIYFSFGYEVI